MRERYCGISRVRAERVFVVSLVVLRVWGLVLRVLFWVLRGGDYRDCVSGVDEFITGGLVGGVRLGECSLIFNRIIEIRISISIFALF